MKLKLIAIILFLLVAVPCSGQSQPLLLTVTPSVTSGVSGCPVTMTYVLTNTLTKVPPFQIVASATYSDWAGNQCTAAPVAVTFTETKPLTIPSLTVTPPLMTLSGGAKVDGATVTPTVSGTTITIPLSKTLLEGQATTIILGFTVQ